MDSRTRKEIIIKSKTKGQVIHGEYIDLYPCTLEDGGAIVVLRNQEKSRYNLNQKEPSTIEGQKKWYEGYLQRNDEICWCICSKVETIIGVIRLYNINLDGASCNQGSFIIDEAYAMHGPYALEAEIITLDFVFDSLQIDKVFNDNRVENRNMNSVSRRIGFQFIEEFERKGARYNLFELNKGNYKRTNLIELLDKWKERD